MFDPVTVFFAVAVAAAVIYFVFLRKKPEPDIDDDAGPTPVVSMDIMPSTLKFGESYTASWNSYCVEALQLSWTGPDGGNAGMSISVPSGSVTNPTGPVGTYDFTLVGTDINGNVVATTTATLVVEPAAAVVPPLEVALEADTVELSPIVIGPTPVVKAEAPAEKPVAVKKPAVKKPAKKAAPKKPAKKAAPKKR